MPRTDEQELSMTPGLGGAAGLGRRYMALAGRAPWLDVLLRGAVAGGLGYAAAPHAVPHVARLASKGSPRVREAVDAFLGSDGGMPETRKRIALLAAGLGAATGLYQHADFRHGAGGLARSLSSSDYWNDPASWPDDPKSDASMLKLGEYMDFGADFAPAKPTFPSIPTLPSVSLVTRDPFLAPPEKKRVSRLILAAGDGKPRLSQMDLSRTAVQSGVDFGVAYAFGRGVGALLGLPPPLSNRLSMAGGIANAIRGSGLLG
jgi:hypothetical protein